MDSLRSGRAGPAVVRRYGSRLLLLSSLAFLLVVSVWMAPASGQGPVAARGPILPGRAVVMPARGTRAGRPGSEGTAAGVRGVFSADIPACDPVPPASQSDCNLTYHNGSVMRTSTTHLVYWVPSGYSFPAGYTALLERYLTDVAHDSGDATFTDSVSTQYYDTVGGGTNYIGNSSPFGGTLTDTTAYPAATATCASLEGSATACLTKTQEFDELDTFVHSKGGARGNGDLWFLVLPPNVQTCYDDYSWCGPYGAGQKDKDGNTHEYCAYHSSFTGGYSGTDPTVWANMPYDPAENGDPLYCSNQHPNGNSADDTINVLSHEMNESMTDPEPSGGWVDDNTTNGGEIGDQCNFVFGTALGSTGTGNYDELINGNTYNVQQEWSNNSTACAMNYGAVAPTASFTYSPSSPKALDTVSFDGSGSKSNNSGGSIIKYSWDFGDGGTGSGKTASHAYAKSGTFTVKLTVEDSSGLSDSTSQDVIVVTRPTTTTYTGDTSGEYNDSVTLSGKLTDDATSTGIANKTLNFTLGADGCSATTNSGGNASCTVTPLGTPGPYPATVSFAGDATYTASNDSKAFTLNQEESKVSYTGPLTSHYHDAVTVSASLTDPEDSDTPVAGKTVTFTLGASDTCSASTDNSGTASCTLTPHQTGAQNIVASFAGDADYVSSSSDPKSFSIAPEETTMAYTGPVAVLAGASGATLTAKLVEDGSNDNDLDGGSPAPVPAETVTLAIGTQTCNGTTDSSGNVSCTIPSVTVPLGPETVGATFAGDSYYSKSSASTTAIVFAFPSRGAFTLGDKTVAAATPSTTVTWWADTWTFLNTLSGGPAPASDKGFAGTVTLPTTTPPGAGACTPNWTTTGGNSPPPASDVPSYMGTLVTSNVTKPNNTISGNTIHIVVVKTNPGYSPNPQNHGTGTIVATFC